MHKIKRGVAVSIFIALTFFRNTAIMAEESYRSEIFTGYSVNKFSHDLDSKSYNAGFNIYFSDVNTKGHPLAEAAFMERAGSVYGAVRKMESDYKAGTVSVKQDGRSSYVNLSLMKPDFPLALHVSTGKGKTEIDYKIPAPYFSEYESKSYGIGIGWFIRDGLALMLDYYDGDSDFKTDYGGIFSKGSSEFKGYSLSCKYVQELSDGLAFNIYTNYSKDEDKDELATESNETYSIMGDLYITPKIGIGVGFSKNKGDNEYAEGETKSLNLSIFVTQNVGFLIYHSIEDPKESGAYKSKYTSGALRLHF